MYRFLSLTKQLGSQGLEIWPPFHSEVFWETRRFVEPYHFATHQLAGLMLGYERSSLPYLQMGFSKIAGKRENWTFSESLRKDDRSISPNDYYFARVSRPWPQSLEHQPDLMLPGRQGPLQCTHFIVIATYVPGSKLLILGMVIPPSIGNPYIYIMGI